MCVLSSFLHLLNLTRDDVYYYYKVICALVLFFGCAFFFLFFLFLLFVYIYMHFRSKTLTFAVVFFLILCLFFYFKDLNFLCIIFCVVNDVDVSHSFCLSFFASVFHSRCEH